MSEKLFQDTARNVRDNERVLLGENKIGNNRWWRRAGSLFTGEVVMISDQNKEIEVSPSLAVIRKEGE